MPRWRVKLPMRPELWVLLAIAVAGVAYVLSSRPRGSDPSPGAPAGTASGDAPLMLHRCILERDYGNARLDIELRVKNTSAETLPMQSPKVKLLAGKNREVPGYFLPFEKQSEIAPNTTQDVQLRYWLEGADLQGALKLEVIGETLEVKSDRPFDLQTMKNGDKKTFKPGEW